MPNYVDCSICTSKELVDLLSYQWSCDPSIFFYAGLPRNYYLFVKDVKAQEHYNISKYSKVIMWLPTFRKSRFQDRNDSNYDEKYGVPLLENDNDIERLNLALQKYNELLIIKLHPVQADFIGVFPNCSNIKLASQGELENEGINFYSMLGMSDALITDYSSVAFDFMYLNRPIGYVIDDIKDYKLGFAFSNALEKNYFFLPLFSPHQNRPQQSP